MKRFFPALNKYNKYIFCDNAGGTQIPEQVINHFYTSSGATWKGIG